MNDNNGIETMENYEFLMNQYKKAVENTVRIIPITLPMFFGVAK